MRDFVLSLKFARRELRAGFRGFYIFMACLVLGVSAIAAVQSLSRGLSESLIYDGKHILGGDIAMRTLYAPATKEQQKFLQKKGVLTVVAETRAMARREDETDAALVELKAVDHFYPLYGVMEYVDEQGNKIDKVTQDLLLAHIDEKGNDVSDYGALVEKELLTRLNLHVGDRIFIGTMPFVINGIIAREPDRISNMGFALAPRVLINRQAAFEKSGLAESGSQVYYSHRIFTPHIKTPAGILALQDDIEKAFPDATWRGRNFYNASPRAERTIDRLTLFLTLIGLATLLVGGVGISNAVRAFLEGKLSNIATLKCLGASRKFVFRVYMTQIFLLAALGIALGVALGASVSLVAGGYITEAFSLTNKVGVYPQALLLAASFGFLTTLVFSLWPLGRAAMVPPSDLFRDLVAHSEKKPSLNVILGIVIAAQAMALLAIASSTNPQFTLWFAGAAAGCFVVFYAYAAAVKAMARRVRGARKPEWRMAVSNLYRPGNVSASIILSLGLGLTVLTAIAMVEYNFTRLLRDDLAADAPSFFFLDIQQGQREGFGQLIEGHAGTRNLLMTPNLRGRITHVNGVEAEKALVDKNEDWVIRSDRGFTYTARRPPYGEMTEGEWWPEDYSGEPLVSISTDVSRAFDIGVGAKITALILGRSITATVANVRDIDWGSFTMNFAVTFAPGTLEGAPATYLATAIVEEAQEIPLQTAIAKAYPNVTVVRVREALAAAEKLFRSAAVAVRASASLALVAGVLVLAGGIAAARRRHIYDSVVLKVLGATQGRVLKTFLLEYALLGTLTVVIAGGLGTLAAYAVLTGVMDMTWKFSPLALANITGLSLLITLGAGFAGTWRALRHKPAPYLRNQ